MLSIGAAMLGSPHVIGVDIDDDALQIAQENCDQFEGLQVKQYPANLCSKSCSTKHQPSPLLLSIFASQERLCSPGCLRC